MRKHPFLRFLAKLILTIVFSITAVVGTVTGVLVLGVVLVAHLVSGNTKTETLLPSQHLSTTYGAKDSSNVFLSIPVKGMILGTKDDVADPLGLLSERAVFGYTVKEQLYEAASDDGIKGVILEINSPGGTIYGSAAIADGVSYYRNKTHKPVLAYISGMGASGAYWVASSADQITGDIGSIIGSIGVISGPFKYYDTVTSEDGGALTGGVVTQRGIENMYITAGTSKDLGNPYRRLTKEEIGALQSMVNADYDRFVSFVSERRHLPATGIRQELGALIYDTDSARVKKLIDTVANREQSYDALAALAKVPVDKYRVVSEQAESGFFKTLLQSRFFGAIPTASPFCPFTKVSLAYYGNTSEFCH